MIVSFGSRGTQDIFDGVDSKSARETLTKELWENARRRLDQLNAASMIEDLRLPGSNRLHKLKGKPKGRYSVSIDMKYRIVFFFDPSPRLVTITNHYK